MNYKLTLLVNDKKFKTEGATLTSAVKKLDKIKFKTHGILVVEHGKKIVEKLLTLRMANKFFSEYTTNITKIVFIKNLKLLLGEEYGKG